MTRLTHFLSLLMALFIQSSAPAWAQDLCGAPEDTAGIPAPLPQVAHTLKPGHDLAILAIGSATMFGPEASLLPGTVTSQTFVSPPRLTAPATERLEIVSELAFPKQMVRSLLASVPGASISITVRGGKGLLATEMLEIMKDELQRRHFDLVLWQTGTVEAVRNFPPGEFGQTLLEGADAAHAAGADLILIDPQFSRFLQTNANLDPYAQALQQVAATPGVVLFRRFDLMRSWVNDGQIDLERTPRAERKKTVETLHACLGQSLARLVLNSSRL